MTTAAPTNTRYHISVLATSTVDSKPSLLVTFDNARYLFNAPESISRICVQSKIALKKVGAVFLGDLEESAGLPGLILSTVEAGNNKLQVYGPEGTEHLVASCRYFTRRDKLSLGVTETRAVPEESTTLLPNPVFQDSNLAVHAFALPATTAESKASMSSSSIVSTGLKRKRSRSSASPSPPPRGKSPPRAPHDASVFEQLGFDPTASNFNPALLRGEAAAHWRSLVVADMFRGGAFTSTDTKSGLVAIQNAAAAVGRRAISPAYLPCALPPPHDAAKDGTALSYLVIGPALRGRFLPAEAQKRGVRPGAAFSKLISGQRVWVPSIATNGPGPNEAAPPKKESKKERSERYKREKEAAAAFVDGEGPGVWVEPGDCIAPGQPAKAFMVLNIPNAGYLDSLSKLTPQMCISLPDQAELRTVFYFLGPGVLEDERLAAYMKTLDASAVHRLNHRISSPDIANSNSITFVPSALLTLRLSYLDPDIFSLPKYSYLSDPTDRARHLPPVLPSTASVVSANDRFDQAHQPTQRESGIDFRNFDFDVPSKEATEEAARLKGSEKGEDIQQKAKEAWERYVPQAEASRQAVKEIDARTPVSDRPGFDMKVTPLGTGSAIPSKYRNVSSTLLHLPEGGYALLDAGEGTWGQLARRFGENGAQEVLRETKLLFISHMHQDHHAGLATLLRMRVKLFRSRPASEPLVIVAPTNARVYLQEQQGLFDLGLRGSDQESDIFFIDSSVLEYNRPRLADNDWRTTIVKQLYACLGLKQVATVPVLHRCRCWGIVIEHDSGWKVVFSGDTMPCDALAVAGHDATLLIHEATIQDDMPEVALAKGHSTFAQAIDIARKMRAHHLLLTHFSARYPKLPPLSRPPADMGTEASLQDSDAGQFEPVIAVAFDMATMRLDEFWKMEQYRQPAMDTLFAWDEDTEPVAVSVNEEATDGVTGEANPEL